MEQYVHTIAQYGTLWHTMAHYGTVYHTVRPKIQTLSESPVISKYVLMTLQTEKSLRNVINQSPHAGAHINENIKGKYSKMAIKFGRNVSQLMFHGLTKTLDD